MNRVHYLFGTLFLLILTSTATAAEVIFEVNESEAYFDIFYTPGPGEEFLIWDLDVSANIGGILDPIQEAYFDDVGDGVALDTFMNTVSSSLGGNAPLHFFFDYHPGQYLGPPILHTPGDALPAQKLDWGAYDTETGDGAIPGLTPYHMARMLLPICFLVASRLISMMAGSVGLHFLVEELINLSVFHLLQSQSRLPLCWRDWELYCFLKGVLSHTASKRPSS